MALTSWLERLVVVGDCWEWPGGDTGNGYGVLNQKGLPRVAHRAVYEFLVGPIPEGLDLDHLCRNRACVNPDHLEPVTRRVNQLRGNGPTGRNARKTHCDHGHEFTPENIYVGRRAGRLPTRECRACRRRRDSAKR